MARARIRRRKWLWFLGLSVAVAIAALSIALNPKERLLMKQAKRVTSVDNGDLSPFLWLSDYEVILMPYHADGDRFEFLRVDTDTGRKTPLDALNQKYRKELHALTLSGQVRGASVTLHTPPACTVSSDGIWLVLYPLDPQGDPSATISCIATKVDGTQETRWKTQSTYRVPLWPYNDHRYLDLVGKSGDTEVLDTANIRDLDNPTHTTPIPVKIATKDKLLLGVTHAGRLLQCDSPLNEIRTSVPLEDDGLSESAPIHKYTIDLPTSAAVRDLTLSPSGDRLAWLLAYNRVPPVTYWMHRLAPGVRLHPLPVLGLWVSNLDGTNMVEIGHKSALPESDTEPDISELQWLPGNKQISFLFRGGLYIVPAP